MSEILLQTQHLSRKSGDAWLLRDVSFSLEAGQLLVLMGPSGSGKSTLLRLLNRMDEATSGHIWLKGEDIRDIPPQSLRRRIGMVMQSPHLFPGTVADNLRFGPRQQGRELSDEKVQELLTVVGLAGFAERDVAKLSGGEAARISLGRTLANEPELLLLDEPTAALDEARSREIEALIASLLSTHGYTAIWITHQTEQARRVADQVMLLRDGQVEALGGPELLEPSAQPPKE